MAQSSQELGIFLTPMQLEQFQVYHEELAEWNQRVNLTSMVECREVQVKHFLDSFTVCLALPGGLNSSIKVVDVGAGAGFPGLPLKIAFPEIQLSLVES
ncbi:MAG: class I SAM-dependent methyltransferase, partial [Chloroflexi bacterium]|nr:class I SAM-dependent methyltransferase [Chloroflexota bacterium]